MTKQVTYAKRNKTYEEIRQVHRSVLISTIIENLDCLIIQTSVRPIPQSSSNMINIDSIRFFQH
eukprot:UN03292